MDVLVKEGGRLPERATTESAGYDLFASADDVIPGNSQILHPLCIHIMLQPGTYAQIYMRSSVARDGGLIVMAGVIDSDYRGEVKIMLRNTRPNPYSITAGQKIAQMVIHKIAQPVSISWTILPGMMDELMYPPCPRDYVMRSFRVLSELKLQQRLLGLFLGAGHTQICAPYLDSFNHDLVLEHIKTATEPITFFIHSLTINTVIGTVPEENTSTDKSADHFNRIFTANDDLDYQVLKCPISARRRYLEHAQFWPFRTEGPSQLSPNALRIGGFGSTTKG